MSSDRSLRGRQRIGRWRPALQPACEEPSSEASGVKYPDAKRVCVLGGTGTVGRATVSALMRRGYDVVCLVRALGPVDRSIEGVIVRRVDFTDPASLVAEGFCGKRFDAVLSCMASRTGAPQDAWAIDHDAHIVALEAAKAAGVGHFVLVSAICVQKPCLAFQHAKLAFEAALMASGLRYTIVRPTAFFKSLSGQIDRVRRGKPFLIFGDGRLTSCKPISDGDLADFIADCLEDPSRWNHILPIGGPGEAITPRDQGEALFAMLGRTPKFRSVPVAFMDGVIGLLGALGRVNPTLAKKAELAKIGRYYGTESMLVFDPKTDHYDAAATPSTGSETLFDYYRSVLAGEVTPERGDHAVF